MEAPRPPLWTYALSLLVVGGLGYAAGRFRAPDKEQELHIVAQASVLKEDTQAREQVRQLTAQLETLKAHTHTERHAVTHPDGTREVTTVKDRQEDRQTQAATAVDRSAELRTVKQEQTVSETTDKRTVTRDRPDWRLGPMVGLNWHTGQVGYGGLAERRLLGPISAGLWGLSSGQAGVSLTVEF